MKQYWTVKNKKDNFAEICREQGITEVTARLLVNRGLTTKQERDAYLHPSFSRLPDPKLLKNAEAAAEMIAKGIMQGKKIRIIGDYDVDGIMSVYILYRCMTAAGANVDYRIPDRIKDGYGLNEDMVQECIEAGADMIVTCDNGIAAMEPIHLAKEAGITVVLTDHHEIPLLETADGLVKTMPEADIIVNPKQEGETTPMTGICGAVVAYKVMYCLAEQTGLPGELLKAMIPYAAMATVCDVMELRGENRTMVAMGLKLLRESKDIGINALMDANQISKEVVGAYHMGFVLGPCLNASGRLDVAVKGLRLLLCENPEEAAAQAQEITELNRTRKDMTAKGVEEAKRQVLEGGKLENVLVIYLPECHESLAGIIAGRIREAFYRPTIILTDAEDGIKGSGRSIDGYHMYEKLCEVQDLLTKFGGHPKAAGMSLPKKNLAEFQRRLVENSGLTEDDLTEKVSIDVILPFGLVTEQVISELKLLEPFGVGNEKPLFGERNLKLLHARILGKNANVLKLNAENEYGKQFEVMYFGDIPAFEQEIAERFGKDALDKLFQGRENNIRINMIYYPETNEFRDKVTLQAVMQYYKI
ncbi:MAG: single-stranded-DNA-specific exonuclease RecJ [Lachnospiraceae bacterium]|nr:single-stranded-DNA-specific exonuclease RecJ [Lachnospiraceae bacterium]